MPRRSIPLPLALAALLAVGAHAGADTPAPRILVTFEVTAPDFAHNLAPASRDLLQRRVAEDVSALARESFGFLEWLSAADAAAAAPDAQLKLSLVADPRQDGSRTSLAFAATVGGQAVDVPELPSVVVYELWDDKPTHDAVELRQHLGDVLRACCTTDDFHRRFQKAFLSRVPLSRRVLVRGEEKRLLIAASWRSLHAGTDSLLRADFSATPGGGSASEGHIRLSPEGPLAADGMQDAVLCRIRQFTFPAVTVEGIEAWHERIPLLLAPDTLKSITVSMEDYQRSATQSGELAGSPDPR